MALSPEVQTLLHQLSDVEKQQALQLLFDDLATEAKNLLIPGMTYEVSSVYDSVEAALQLQELLDKYEHHHEQD